MSKRESRNVIDLFVHLVVISILIIAGAGLWSLIILPYAMWNHWRGMAHKDLSD